MFIEDMVLAPAMIGDDGRELTDDEKRAMFRRQLAALEQDEAITRYRTWERRHR
jgi:hypothetical protein